MTGASKHTDQTLELFAKAGRSGTNHNNPADALKSRHMRRLFADHLEMGGRGSRDQIDIYYLY